MKKEGSNLCLSIQASVVAGFLIGATPANAANNFSDIARNVNDSIEELPGLLTGVAYLFGLLLGVLGILKLKDHVENPTQTPLKDGAIRLASGGALFALPIVYEAMRETVGDTSALVDAAPVSKVTFNLK